MESNIQSFDANSLSRTDGSYWIWGEERPVPIQIHGLTNVKQSFESNIVMKNDGSTWFWQQNDPSREIELHQINQLNRLVDIQQKWNTMLALDEEGRVFHIDLQGKLDTNQIKDINYLKDLEDIIGITSYYEYRPRNVEWRWIFLKKDGTVWINKGSFPNVDLEPMQSLNNIVDIQQNIALKQDGTVWTWAYEFDSEVVTAPIVTLIEELSDIKKIKTYGNSNLAIDQENNLWFWGVTLTGYSDGTTRHYQWVPVKLNTINAVKDAFVIERSLIVLTDNGDVYVTSIQREAMSENPNFQHLMEDVEEIKAGARHLILQKKDGSLWGWGINKNGQLGVGDFKVMYDTPQPMQKPVSVYINSETVVMNSGVIIKNGQAFIPLRSIFENMGATIDWDTYSKTVIIGQRIDGREAITINVNYTTGVVHMNNQEMIIANQPFIIGGTAYLPLRFISEALGGRVEWISGEDKILIFVD